MARGIFLGSVGALVVCAATVVFGTSDAQEVPGCRDAWNDLNARDSLGYARTLIETDCPVMYRQGWLMRRCETLGRYYSGLCSRLEWAGRSGSTIIDTFLGSPQLSRN